MFEIDNAVCAYDAHIDALYGNIYSATHDLNESQPFNFFDIATASEEHFSNMQVTDQCYALFTSIDGLQQNNYTLGQDIRNCLSHKTDCASVETIEEYDVLDTLMIDQYLHDIKELVIERTQHILEVLNLDEANIAFLTNNGCGDTASFHRDTTLSELYEDRNMCVANDLNTYEFGFIFNIKGLEKTTLFYKPYAPFDKPISDLTCIPTPSDDITIPHTLFRAAPHRGAVFLRGENGSGAIHSAPVLGFDFQRFTVVIAPYHYKQKSQYQELFESYN